MNRFFCSCLWIWVLCLLLCWAGGRAQAQTRQTQGTSANMELIAPADSAGVQLMQLRQIVLQGNKVTQSFVIMRELPVKLNEWVTQDRLQYLVEKSYENLNNLDIFNYIRVWYTPDDLGRSFTLHIEVEEQWYIWPLVSIIMEDRNFSSWIKNMDLERTTIEGGLYLRNIMGLNLKSIVTVKWGYTKGFRFALNNMSLDRSGRHQLSLDLSANTNNKLDLATVDNKPLNYKGGRIIARTQKARLTYQHRLSLLRSLEATATLERTHLDPMVLEMNSNYWGNADTLRKALRLDLSYVNDHRDYRTYPTDGFYYRMAFKGYSSTNGDVWSMRGEAQAKYYYHLSDRWTAYHLGNVMYNYSNREAWILNKAMGYDANVIRGYEHHVTDGPFFCSVNNSLRYEIMPTKIVVLNWLSRLPKLNKIHFTLYGNLHFDAGYTYQPLPLPHDVLSNRLLFAGGFGLDLVSYYGITLGVDFSVNRQGGKGFFFTLQSPLN